jgi:hypothetical protein
MDASREGQKSEATAANKSGAVWWSRPANHGRVGVNHDENLQRLYLRP